METKHESSRLYLDNARLNDAEYALRRIYLQSMPRQLTIVLGNRCNLDCPHCYQVKNDDNLLRDPEIGQALRREFAGLYPYLSTLRIQGGEVFTLRGFREMVEDVEATVDRPLISISTNGTLINDEWARRIVQIPFQCVTFSIDGGTAATVERLRRGARFETIIQTIQRLQSLKSELKSPWPRLDAFFVLMRSNYREIPQFMELMKSLSIEEVAFQIMLLDNRNLTREPGLEQETIESREDVGELERILRDVLQREGKSFRRISICGVHALLSRWGFDPSFLDEETRSLYPGHASLEPDGFPSSDDYAPGPAEPQPPVAREQSPADHEHAGQEIKLCPNPWSMLQVSENGDASICFLSDPIGNLYQMPLARIWNHPRAIAQRSEMIAGRYLSAGCSKFSCDWREGKSSDSPDPEEWRQSLLIFKEIIGRVPDPSDSPGQPETPASLTAVRRLLEGKERRILELEATLADLWEKNGHLHHRGQAHIDSLEAKVRELSARVAVLEPSGQKLIRLIKLPVHLLRRLTRWSLK